MNMSIVSTTSGSQIVFMKCAYWSSNSFRIRKLKRLKFTLIQNFACTPHVTRYVSPDPSLPDTDMLAAAAVREWKVKVESYVAHTAGVKALRHD